MADNKQKAIDFFIKKNFNLANFYLSLELQKNPDNEELKFLSLLSYIALENPDEALIIFEIYETQKYNNGFLDFDIFDKLLNYDENILGDLHEKQKIENGISFKDFIKIVEKEKDFKKVYENLKFSTKLFISNKDDFKLFLDLLMKNNYKKLSLKYAEKALSIFPLDSYFKEIIVKLNKEKK